MADTTTSTSRRVGSLEELALYESLRLGSSRAFQRLVAQHQPAMLRVASLHTHDPTHAARLVHEALLRALGGLEMFTWHTSFQAWLFAILLDHCHPDSRGRGPAVVPPSQAPPVDGMDPTRSEPSWANLPWSPAWSPQAWAEFDRAFAALSPTHRDTTHLRDIEGWTFEEVRDTVGLTVRDGIDVLHEARSALGVAVGNAMSLPTCPTPCDWPPTAPTEWMEGTLRPAEHERFGEHLSDCVGCSCTVRRLEGIREIARTRPLAPGATTMDASLRAEFRRWRAARRRKAWQLLVARRG